MAGRVSEREWEREREGERERGGETYRQTDIEKKIYFTLISRQRQIIIRKVSTTE